MNILQVKEYNFQARQRFSKAVEEWRSGERGQYPFIGFYIFTLSDGNERRNGYVASDRDKHCFGMNRWEAEKNLNK